MSSIARASHITREEFDATLARYPALIASVSASKPPTKGTKSDSSGPSTLSELDHFRLSTLPTQLATLSPGVKHLTLPQLTTLMKWKLLHGTWRPTLMSLIRSNPAETVEEVTRKGFAAYSPILGTTLKAVLTVLTGLKGVGPATASLLLSVMSPETVPFFGDEAFRWLFHEADGGGGNDPKGWGRKIKYDLKEYLAYVEKVSEVRKRLGVQAREVEMVGWVVGREAMGLGVQERKGDGDKLNGKVAKKPAVEEKPPVKAKKQNEGSGKKTQTKRKRTT